jgi:hypothetical protein
VKLRGVLHAVENHWRQQFVTVSGAGLVWRTARMSARPISGSWEIE